MTHAEESIIYLESVGRSQDIVRIIEARLGRGEQADSTLLGPLCMAYGKLKHFDKLFDCVARLEARIAGGDRRIKSDNFWITPTATQAEAVPGMLLSAAYLDLGDYPRSIREGERALATLPDSSGGVSMWPPIKFHLTILPNLVIAATLGGNQVQARKYLAQLENVPVPSMGSAYWAPYKSNALAGAYLSLGEYAKAVENLGSRNLAFKFALSVVNLTSHGDDAFTMYEAPRLFMLAKAQSELGNLKEAKVIFGNLFAFKRLSEIGEIYWLALYERGRIAAKESDAAGATEYWSNAVEVIERQRSTISTEASKIGFVGNKQAVYARLIAVLIEQGRIAEAFDYVERSKSRALVDMLASKKDFAAPDQEQTRLVLAQLDVADLSRRVQNEGAKPDEQVEGTRNLQVAQQALQSAAPELSSLVTVTSVPSNELKSLVGADETLVEYYYQGNNMYAFILDREHLQSVQLDASEIGPQVQNLRRELEEPGSSAWQGNSHALYQRLWKPLEKLVGGKNIIVVPHGVLHYLPFAALQDDTGEFLIDRYGLRFLPSASVLKYLRPVMQKLEAPMLVLGNPDLGDPRLDLAFAEGEARLVGGMIPGSRVLLRKEASETNFKKAGGVFTRIHFATHGKFQADDPLSSGLYLAKDAENDGVLTVGELYSMTLNADLVTLSACETGLGKIANGDDVVGLTRGFLYAGSRSIVASLWSVDDQATAALMQAFYKNLSTMNKREALRQSQIKARESFPHPFYWAAFQLTGRAD